jgi:hypothetical protein
MIALLALGTLAWNAIPVAGQGKGGDGARYGWLSSLEEGRAQARKTGKPLMVVIRCVP